MLIARTPADIEPVLFEYHMRLATAITEKLKGRQLDRIAEIGAGPGNFTVPFILSLGGKFERYVCVDSFTGHYAEHEPRIHENLAKRGLDKRVEIVKRDAAELHEFVSDFDLIVGHEILCDLNMEHAGKVMAACHASLKTGGVLVHSEFSPFARDRCEELLQVLNNDYSTNRPSDAKWFSPTADELAGLAHAAGFRSVEAAYVKIPIRFVGEAAIELGRRWHSDCGFFEKHKKEIFETGMGYPMEQVIYCHK